MKKIIIIFVFINIFVFSIFLLIYTIFFFQNKSRINYIETNTIKIIKKSEIIKNSENPKGIFNNEININENILTGFFIDKTTILTVAHGTNSTNSEYEIIDINGGKTYSGKLIFKDSENDLAKIEIENNFKNFRKIKLGKDIKVLEKIHSYSFSKDGYNLEKKSGTILEINNNKIKTDIVFQDGNSGGIVINEKNEILGIIVEVDEKEKVGYFTKIYDLLH